MHPAPTAGCSSTIIRLVNHACLLRKKCPWAGTPAALDETSDDGVVWMAPVLSVLCVACLVVAQLPAAPAGAHL